MSMYKHCTEIKWLIGIYSKVNVLAKKILQVLIFNINALVLLRGVIQIFAFG